jgi:hypothetical protein
LVTASDVDIEAAFSVTSSKPVYRRKVRGHDFLSDTWKESRMQNLAIADDLVAPTKAGLKKNTIRAGVRDIRIGPLELRSSSGTHRVIEVEVVEVSHKLAKEVSDREIVANGFRDLEDMLIGMKRFYPDFGPASQVTVITWG